MAVTVVRCDNIHCEAHKGKPVLLTVTLHPGEPVICGTCQKFMTIENAKPNMKVQAFGKEITTNHKGDIEES